MQISISDKKKCSTFVSIFQLLKTPSSQINAVFDTDHFHIQGMDKSHVCLYDLVLKKEWFDEYNVPTKSLVCFNSSTFHSIIDLKGADQVLTIKKDTEDTIVIELINGEKKGTNDYNKFFTMPLIEYDYEEMNIPETDYDSEFILPSKKVTDILSNLATFGDNITIKCTQEHIDLTTSGSAGEMRVNIPVDDMTSYGIIEDGEVELTYSLTYLSKMCLTSKLTTDVEFFMSSECPMKIRYDFGENSSLTFHIAPKME